MGRRNSAPPQPYFAAITLGSAVVRAEEATDDPVEWWSQAEAQEHLGVTDRTLRSWAEIGLPVRKGPHGRPIYPAGGCRVWANCWRDITTNCQRYKKAAPAALTLIQARNWRQLKDAVEGMSSWRPAHIVEVLGVSWLDTVVIVPNDCSAPHRARQLRLAVQGVATDDDHECPGDDQLLADLGVPRGYQRPDIGWPAAPAVEAAAA